MYVVWNASTGYSDESMRFATKEDARAFIAERQSSDRLDASDTYAIRREGEPVSMTGRW